MARLRKTMDCGCKVSVNYNDMIKIDCCKIHSDAEKSVKQERIKWCKSLMKIGILVSKPEDLENLQRIGKEVKH